VEKGEHEKRRKKELTKEERFAILIKLSRAVELQRRRGKKVLKKQKIMLDKTKMVWYTNQAVWQEADANESAEKTSKKVEKSA